MLVYIILAEICLTVGAPNWVVTLCWIASAYCFIVKGLAEFVKNVIKDVKKDPRMIDIFEKK